MTLMRYISSRSKVRVARRIKGRRWKWRVWEQKTKIGRLKEGDEDGSQLDEDEDNSHLEEEDDDS